MTTESTPNAKQAKRQRYLAKRAERRETCEWREDDEGNWDSRCDEKWVFTDGGPAENRARFCHGCGGRIVVRR